MLKLKIKESIDMKELATYLMENMPECSLNLDCISYNYDQGVFKFFDYEENKKYTVTVDDVAKVLPKFLSGLGSKWNFYGLKKPSSSDTADDIAGDFDADAIDGLIQLVIFGEIIYS